jgi:hypothetical protein
MATTLTPVLTSTPNSPTTYNTGIAETFSWVPVEGAGRPLYAKVVYPIEIVQQLTTITNVLCAILAK